MSSQRRGSCTSHKIENPPFSIETIYTEKQKKMPKSTNKILGVGARVWVRTKYIHPKKVIASKYGLPDDDHKMERLVVIRQETKKIGKKETPAIVMTHKDFKEDGVPVELYCNEKYCHVSRGASNGFDQTDGDDPDGILALQESSNSESSGRDTDLESGFTRMSRQVSMLAASDDPFAPREGKSLVWKDINMTLKGKNDTEDRKLLQDVWGEVPEKQTTAIMGPSGAGKTSLLNILAGRATSRGNLSIESDVRLNNFAVDPTDIHVRQHIAFVAQDDSLQVTSTPREAIYFSAKLRLPKSTPERHLHKLVDKMLEELGLEHCADTIVGGPLLKGISGGERKRTSVGVELVVRPAMVFLDEPTSGLDSFSAVQLCQVLKKVANAGSSVLFTIHQPASEIFNSFDRLILMNKGRVMYQGRVKDVPRYFKDRGQAVPENYNPSDWIMNVAQANAIEELEDADFFPSDERKLPEPFTEPAEGKNELGITIREGKSIEADSTTVGFQTQTMMLFNRELRNLTRDKSAFSGRMGFSVVLSLLIGLIFYKVGEQPSDVVANINSHFGALIMIMMMGMMGTAQQALLAFPQERPVFLREYSTNHYSVLSYFLARFTVEAIVTALQVFVMVMVTYWLVGIQMSFGSLFLVMYGLAMASTALSVMLGCAVEDPKLGQEMLPVLFVPQLLFAGFFVAPHLMPSWLSWARYLFALTYSVRIGVVEEFKDGVCVGGEQAMQNCNGLLQSLDASEDDLWWNWLVLLALFAFFRALALFILRRKATKFF